MYPAPFNYHRPATLDEALGLLTKFGDSAYAMAGGQSLIPMMKLRIGASENIVDIGRLPDLDYIDIRGDALHIGALARHADIAAADESARIPMLRDCAGGIADKQVRNMGTIGGGLAIADPSGDWPCCLTALEATIVCAGSRGTRSVAIGDFIQDSYETALANDELVTEVQIGLPPDGSGSAHLAFKRAAAAYPSATASVALTMDGDTCRSARITLGAAGSTPIVSVDADQLLQGKQPDRQLLQQSAEIVVAASSPPADARGSEAFKRAMLRSLVVEAAERALARSRGEAVKGGHRYA